MNIYPRTAARRGAISALVQLERDDTVPGIVLDALQLAPESLPFARELVSGSLRQRALLDWTLFPLLRKPLQKLDAPVRAALRLAAYERAFLHTPAPAVANDYAEAMRAARVTSAVAFVNAVARRLPDEPRAAPDMEKNAVRHLSIAFSHPEWLVQRWLDRFGFDGCRDLLQANNSIAPLTLRVNSTRATRDAVRQTLSEREIVVRDGAHSSDSLIVENAGSPLSWPEWQKGEIIAQDEAAQLVSLFAAPVTGQTVIDAAAAPGGKSTHMAQLMEGSGQIIACDAAPGRIKLVTENAHRLGFRNIKTQIGDFRQLSAKLPAADMVLLDAPCLGTGTFRRRPDARWKKDKKQLDELVALQRELMEAAIGFIKPKGILVYSTCSLEPEENEDQIRAFLDRHPDWQVAAPPTQFGGSPLEALVTHRGFLQTLPHRDGCDGTFAARLQRSA
jgi:16S rRNA (cytosine967-C5)-methyltransferase